MDEVKKNIDIKENSILHIDNKLLAILLKDRSSGQNLIWATDTYAWRGNGFASQDYITIKTITGMRGNVIKPRTAKSQKEQKQRIKNKAEVFTPSWVCNRQNNLIDNAWFDREGVFNIETDKGWQTNQSPIVFPETPGKSWQDYVKAKRIEITCGEAPYLTSRYDAVTGKYIGLTERIGLLDRKLRVVSENVSDEQCWVKWATIAFQSVYGFDFQGDNVLIARENLLYTFADAYEAKFGLPPITEYLIQIAKILAWNIWQMDGLKYVIPYSCKPPLDGQLSMFDDELESKECPGCQKHDNTKHTGIYCRIMNWSRQHSETFISQLRRAEK